MGTVGDLSGNTRSGFSRSFTTATTPNTIAPTIAGVSPVNGLADVPINVRVQVQFDEPVQQTDITDLIGAGTLSLFDAGAAVPVFWSLDGAQQLLP